MSRIKNNKTFLSFFSDFLSILYILYIICIDREGVGVYYVPQKTGKTGVKNSKNFQKIFKKNLKIDFQKKDDRLMAKQRKGKDMQVYKNRISIDLRVFEACYSHIKMHRIAKIIKTLSETTIMDGMDVTNADEHDKVFKPKDAWEEKLWNSCREIAKKEIRALHKCITAGKNAPQTKEEKQAAIQKAINNIGQKRKNTIEITPQFIIPQNEYFNIYRKEYPTETESVQQWLRTSKLVGKTINYTKIGEIIRKFREKRTGKIL